MRKIGLAIVAVGLLAGTAMAQNLPVTAEDYMTSPIRSARYAFCSGYVGGTATTLIGLADGAKNRDDVATVTTALESAFWTVAMQTEGSDGVKAGVKAGSHQADIYTSDVRANIEAIIALHERCLFMANDDPNFKATFTRIRDAMNRN